MRNMLYLCGVIFQIFKHKEPRDFLQSSQERILCRKSE